MKILTAIGNPILNEKLKKLENISVVGKDVQYQEGVLEILEKDSSIESLIISDNLPGEISFYKLISKIKKIKSEIDIYVFLENKREGTENYLISQGIYKIYYLKEINFNEFIKNFKENKNNLLNGINEEINNLKKLIMKENKYEKKGYKENLKNDEENKFFDNKEKDNNFKKTIKYNYSFIEDKINEVDSTTELGKESMNIIEKSDNYCKKDYEDCDNNFLDNRECNTIAISGNFGSGKSLFSCFLSKVISNQNKKTLLIDFDLENNSINTIFGVKKYKEKQTYIEDYILNVDKKLDIFCGIDRIINIKENSNNNLIKEIIERLKNYYDFIIIDVSSRIDLKYVKIILMFCDKIIFLIEPNLLEISKSNKILEVFINDFYIDVDKIKIVFNKSNKYKIAESVLEEIFSEFEIIENIEYEEKYNLFINKNTNYEFEKIKFEKVYEKLLMKEGKKYAKSSVRSY